MAVLDDVIYGILLLISVAVGHKVKAARGARSKQLISTAIGISFVVVVCGKHGLHSLLTTLVNAAIVIYIHPSISHIVSFIWCFGYIVFFRTCHHFGLPQVVPHSNAVQLLLTLKMVGLAFEIHDTFKNKTKWNKDNLSEEALRAKYQEIKPTFVDIFCYGYCYVGLLTGPYYKYRTYHDMLYHDNLHNIDTVMPLWRRLKMMPVYIATFLICSAFFSIDYVREEAFFSLPFWYRLLYMVPMFMIFRNRLYIAWLASECMCIAAGLGLYPAQSKPKCGQGPTDFSALEQCKEQAPEGIAYDPETIHNIHVYGCEFAPTLREGMRSWNMSVQFWLANYVYKRVPVKSGPTRVTITMMVSAFWHGVHPGYYLAFIFVPFALIAEDSMIAAFRKNRSAGQQLIFDWVCWFFKMRCFDYMCMGFLLLTYRDTMNYWSSIYYIGHIYLVVATVVSLAFKSSRSRSSWSQQADVTSSTHKQE